MKFLGIEGNKRSKEMDAEGEGNREHLLTTLDEGQEEANTSEDNLQKKMQCSYARHREVAPESTYIVSLVQGRRQVGGFPWLECGCVLFCLFIGLFIVSMIGVVACKYVKNFANQTQIQDKVIVSSGGLTLSWPGPPPHEDVTRVARYVVHISDWASIATISTADPITGFPFANIISISDGPVGNSSGTPYAYITRMDLSGKDLLKDSRATLSLSEAQSDYCRTHDYDPENPQCARVLLSGTVQEVKNGTSEAAFARKALFSRHPEMESWPTDHNWLFVKLDITHIYVLDFFGGASEVDVNDYYNINM